jgi:outer membrane immunogenic protein
MAGVMKRMAFGLAAVLATVLPLGMAEAADMAVKAPPLPAPAADTWTGFYVGANAGYEWLHSSAYGIAPDPATLVFINGSGTVFPGALSGRSGEGGVQIGYNWHVQYWVLGFEADFQASGGQAQATLPSATVFGPNQVTNVASLNRFGTARLRAGWLVTPSTLVYATGGFAYGRTSNTMGVVEAVGICAVGVGSPGCAFSGSVTHNDTGWAFGGGLEQQIPNSKVSLGIEYLYVQLNGTSFNTACTNVPCSLPPATGQAVVTTGKLDTQIVRAKLNFLF